MINNIAIIYKEVFMLINMLAENWAFIFGLITILAFVYRTTSKLDNLIGKDIKGRNLIQRLERIEYQLWPNEGQSMADKVNRLSENQSEMKLQLTQLCTKMDYLSESMKK